MITMKKLLFFLAVLTTGILSAQAPPQGINYQAVARNTSGAELQNTPLTVRIGIYTDASATNQAYEETHAVTTNSFGLFNVIIGQGTQTSVNAFNTILWANSAYYLKVEIDGGSGFTNMGTTQLMSVPYALYAGASAGGPTGSTGATGPQGPTGATGTAGINGATGSAGPTGATGTAGTNGSTGATGTAGTNGATGATGPSGADGLHCWDLNGNGVNDPAEDINGDNSWNSLDCMGATGAAGPTGAQGATGTAGTNGATGPTGAAGTNGANGATGPTGAAGTNGTNGATGPTGAAGTNGTNGATGPTGAAGTNGANGATGPTGAAGTNGANGATGPTGAAGTNGANGATGPTGAAGTNGTNGATGPTGAAGTNGTNGATGPTGPTWTINSSSFGTDGSLSIGTTIPSIITSGGGVWRNIGNSGMTSSNFIGNIDNQPFIFRTSNSERMRIDANGNVGIGTPGPTVKLDVLGGSVRITDVNSPNLTAFATGANSSSFLALVAQSSSQREWRVVNDPSGGGSFKITDMGAGLDRIYINSAGSVGIGTSIPNSLFEVATDGSLTNGIRISNSSNTMNGPSLYFDATNVDWTITGSNAGNGSGADKLVFRNYSNAVDLFALDASGNVGIGTDFPGIFPGSNKYLTISAGNSYGINPVSLELQGANTSTLVPFAQIDFASYGAAADNVARIDARRGGSTSMGTLVFSTNDGTALTERMRIKETGNVGINIGGSNISANAMFAVKDGHIQIQQTTGPTVAALSGAGTGASAVLTTINPKSTDVCGRVTVTTGTGAITTGGYVTITFNKTYASNPLVIITPANANSGNAEALYGMYVTSTTTGFTINFASPTVTSTPFAFNYMVFETQ
jgi:hypothetical protein